MEQYDVIIIGAGAAGLMAAKEISLTGKKVGILEAKNRTGGRIHPISHKNFSKTVEAGAEFIHGDLKLTISLLKRANVSYYKVNGSMWQKHEGKLQQQSDFVEDYSEVIKKLNELEQDISVQQFMDKHLADEKHEEARFTLQNYVQGYYAADTSRASSFSLRKELSTTTDVQYRIAGGYIKLVEFLEQQLQKNNVNIFLSHPVKEIKWKKDLVEINTSHNVFTARKILLTVPVGVLQSEQIMFSPSIPAQINAAKRLGYGNAVKVILEFEEAFWKNRKLTEAKDLSDMQFIFSEEEIPTWWTQHPKDEAIITGWLAGTKATQIKDLKQEQVIDKAICSLANIFNTTAAALNQMLIAGVAVNWTNDHLSCGAYSYEVVNGKQAKQVLTAGVEDTIFFAGEGLHDGPEIGTVEAALISGRDRAHQVIAAF